MALHNLIKCVVISCLALFSTVPADAGSRADRASTAKSAETVPVISNMGEAIRNVPVVYPPAALASGISGYVLVQFSLPDDGHPEKSVVVLAEPKGVFEEISLQQLQALRYEVPAQWVLEHPNRRLELVFMYVVAGAAFPQMPPFRDAEAIATIRRRPE